MKSRSRMIEVSSYDVPLIVHGLKEGLERSQKDLELLIISKKRDLTDDERSKLPSTLQNALQDELRDNIDAWVSLVQNYESLIKEFDISNW